MREDWKVVKLGEFAAHEKGKKPKNQKTEKDDVFEYPYVNIEAFEKGIIEHYTDGEKCNFCYENDFLMVWDGSRSGLVGKGMDGALGSTLVRINFPGIENNYAFHYLSSKYQEINTRAKGTGTPHVDPYLLWSYDFPIAPLPEQRAIVDKIEELFSDLDKGIADLNKAKDQLVIFRQAVLKKAFEGELTKEWREKQTNLPTADEILEQIKEERERFYNQQLLDWKTAVKEWEKNGKLTSKPIKPRLNSETKNLSKSDINSLPIIPNSWAYFYLAYAGDLGRGKSKHRPRNDKRLFGGIYPFIQTAEVKAQEIITQYDKCYSDFGLAQSKIWPKGTLCITIAANIAETGFLGIDACFPDSIVGFTPFEGIVDSNYIDYFFKSAKARITAYAPATAQKNINLNTLENLVIPFCNRNEQNQVLKEIESRLSVCDKVEQSIVESLEKAKTLRQSILKKAFEGTLLSNEEIERCKQEEDYEPASVLLEKIKNEKKK
jgi:type I restriction enzyme S subunit